MDEGRIPRCGMVERRRKGRPRIRWKAEVEEDLREMGITGWRPKAKNGDSCKHITKQAMGLLMVTEES
jgi:hypothetical protein